MTTLPPPPTNLADLLEIGLNDLAKVEEKPEYGVAMNSWHGLSGGLCFVCLGGAVMAGTLKVSRKETVLPRECGEWEDCLYALDSLRVGDVEEALFWSDFSTAVPTRYVPGYHADRPAWWSAMRELLKELRAEQEAKASA